MYSNIQKSAIIGFETLAKKEKKKKNQLSSAVEKMLENIKINSASVYLRQYK